MFFGSVMESILKSLSSSSVARAGSGTKGCHGSTVGREGLRDDPELLDNLVALLAGECTARQCLGEDPVCDVRAYQRLNPCSASPPTQLRGGRSQRRSCFR